MTMTKKIARRSLLRSALAGGAVLAAGGSALATTANAPNSPTAQRARNTTPEMQILLKYAGEFGGGKHR